MDKIKIVDVILQHPVALHRSDLAFKPSMCNIGYYSLVVFLYWHYMFRPNRSSFSEACIEFGWFPVLCPSWFSP
jgi:hypothetical protein